MADEFDDIFGDVSPPKPKPDAGGASGSAVAAGGSAGIDDFDAMLSEFETAITTPSKARAATDEFDDIFGDVSPAAKTGGGGGGAKNGGGGSSGGGSAGKMTSFEKDDFMG